MLSKVAPSRFAAVRCGEFYRNDRSIVARKLARCSARRTLKMRPLIHSWLFLAIFVGRGVSISRLTIDYYYGVALPSPSPSWLRRLARPSRLAPLPRPEFGLCFSVELLF